MTNTDRSGTRKRSFSELRRECVTWQALGGLALAGLSIVMTFGGCVYNADAKRESAQDEKIAANAKSTDLKDGFDEVKQMIRDSDQRMQWIIDLIGGKRDAGRGVGARPKSIREELSDIHQHLEDLPTREELNGFADITQSNYQSVRVEAPLSARMQRLQEIYQCQLHRN